MAQGDFFLKIDGIDGESKDSKHPSELELDSWSWGETNAGSFASYGGGGSGKVSMQDFHFVINAGKHSPKVMQHCATGEHIGSGTLTCRKAGTEQQEFLKIKFTDLLISSYQVGATKHGDVLPTDQISFNFAKIEFEYKPQDEKGNLGGAIKAGYDLKANKKI
jgi:type VI secretion system secreted protein Hcp